MLPPVAVKMTPPAGIEGTMETQGMGKRLIVPTLFGVVGVAILVSLGVWQMQRLAWKEAMIAAIEARMGVAPVALPGTLDPERDLYLPVRVDGTYTGEAVQVLSAAPQIGPGVRVIAVLQTTDGRRVLVDRGFAPEAARGTLALVAEGVSITGNLQWPDDTDGFTPPPDLRLNLWFSRNVAPIAAHLGTEAVMIVARTDAPVANLTPRPIAGAEVKNDHLGYAMTWFLLAAVWAGMTGFLLWRITRSKA